MIVGVEGLFEWTPIEGAALTLNDRTGQADREPRYQVDTIEGLSQSGDFDQVADQRAGRPGEEPRYGETAGKTVTMEGTIVAPGGFDQLRAMDGALMAAFADKRPGGVMVARLPNGSLLTTPPRRFTARPLDCATSEEQTMGPKRTRSGGFERPFSIVLRLADPRLYHLDPVVVEDDTIAEVEGVGLPFKPGTQLTVPDAPGIAVEVDLPGTMHVEPVLHLRGPFRAPVVVNQRLGVFLRFRNIFRTGSGIPLVIDFRTRDAYFGDPDGDPADWQRVRGYLDTSSTWWDRGVRGLVPGEQSIAMRGAMLGEGASLKVIATPADS